MIFGDTWLGWLNRIILQWFFVRLARVMDRDEAGNLKQTGWCWLRGVVPLTGWSTSYKFIGKRKRA